MSILVFGINHRSGPVSVLERVALPADEVPKAIGRLASRDNVREVMGRVPYRTPRIDQRLVLIVTHVDGLELPPGDQNGGQARLEILRDRALIRTLFTSGMRREEVSTLSRADVQDGHARQALITGKGSKERLVFFDEKALLAIRAYLDARGDRLQPLFLRHDLGRGKQPGPGGRRSTARLRRRGRARRKRRPLARAGGNRQSARRAVQPRG